MNDSEPIWFYSAAGQQKGPVTLDELKAKAKEGVLNPRHDMVWKQGMKDWQPAGEVAEIFERRAVAEPPAVPPAAQATAAATVNPDPYAPPAAIGVDAEALQHATWPGVRRRSYILVAIVLPILVQFGAALMVPFMAQGANAPEPSALLLLVVMLAMFVLVIYFGLQRLANVGMSRWWYLGNLVPILNLWIGYRMLACPAGYAYHKKLDGPGIALAILYWLMILSVFLLAIGMAVFAAGLAGSPEFQQQMEQLLNEISASSGQ